MKQLFFLKYLFFLYLLLYMAVILTPCHSQNAPVVSNMDRFTRFVLPNGVRLLIKPETVTEQVAISLFIRMGPDTRPEDPAVGEMVARSLFYGNSYRTQNGILTLANQAGGNIDVLRTPEYVAVSYVTLPSQLPEATHLLCDCLKNAEFAPESLQRALKSIHSERSARHEEAFTLGYDIVCSQLGVNYPSEESMRRVTQKQAQAFFHRHYLPARTVISVVGHLDKQATLRFFTAFLANYTQPDNLRLSPLPDPISDSPETIVPPPPTSVLTLQSPSEIAYAFVAASAPSVRSPDYPAFVVLHSLLGGGHACRLFQQARESLGLGYAVGAQFQADRSDPLVIYLQWNPKRLKQDTVKLLQTLLDDVILHPPTEQEIIRARNFAIGQHALLHERAHERAFFAGWFEALGLKYAYDQEFPNHLAAVTREDVLRVARTYLGSRAAVLVIPTAEKN